MRGGDISRGREAARCHKPLKESLGDQWEGKRSLRNAACLGGFCNKSRTEGGGDRQEGRTGAGADRVSSTYYSETRPDRYKVRQIRKAEMALAGRGKTPSRRNCLRLGWHLNHKKAGLEVPPRNPVRSQKKIPQYQAGFPRTRENNHWGKAPVKKREGDWIARTSNSEHPDTLPHRLSH